MCLLSFRLLLHKLSQVDMYMIIGIERLDTN